MAQKTILFIHQAFPSQFEQLAGYLAYKKHKVYALALDPQKAVPNVMIYQYSPIRKQEKETPGVLQDFDAKVIRGESVYKALQALKEKGLKPDVIYAHPGWGEAMYVRNIWPDARLVVYAEWFYNLHGQEVNFDPALPPLTEEQTMRLPLKNVPFMQALQDCDAAITPTQWQKSRYPDFARGKIQVIPDGLNYIELSQVLPRPLGIPAQNLKLRKGMPIVTFVSRYLEPIRGFHYFMRALPTILSNNKDAHVIIMGHDSGVDHVGYGDNNPGGVTWREQLEKELGNSVDWSRVHFMGFLERKLYLALLKLSACHVYLTAPFILSWSFLEAAAMGLPIVASNTAPVLEFKNLNNVEYVEFDDVRGIAEKVLKRLADKNFKPKPQPSEVMGPLDMRNTIPATMNVLFDGLQEERKPAADPRCEQIVFLED